MIRISLNFYSLVILKFITLFLILQKHNHLLLRMITHKIDKYQMELFSYFKGQVTIWIFQFIKSHPNNMN